MQGENMDIAINKIKSMTLCSTICEKCGRKKKELGIYCPHCGSKLPVVLELKEGEQNENN